MSFNPDHEVQVQRAHLERLAADPAWREYVADQARRMAREEHGMWKPLADLPGLIFPKEERHARHRS